MEGIENNSSQNERHVSTHKMICWQIINYCNRECPFCISQSNPKKPILNSDREGIVKRFNELGVEKISISGGEPFLFPEIGKIIQLVHELGMDVQITTNADLLMRKLPSWFLEYLPPLNFSFYGNAEYHAQYMGNGHYNRLLHLAKKLNSNCSLGANFMLSDDTFPYIEQFLADTYDSGFSRVLFITKMPSRKKSKITDKSAKWVSSIKQSLSGLDIEFSQGVRLHDYRKDLFFIVCNELGVLFINDKSYSSQITLGSIFDKTLSMPNNGNIPIKTAINNIWNKRYQTNSIKLIN